MVVITITYQSRPRLTIGFAEEELVPSMEPEKSCSSTVAEREKNYGNFFNSSWKQNFDAILPNNSTLKVFMLELYNN